MYFYICISISISQVGYTLLYTTNKKSMLGMGYILWHVYQWGTNRPPWLLLPHLAEELLVTDSFWEKEG